MTLLAVIPLIKISRYLRTLLSDDFSYCKLDDIHLKSQRKLLEMKKGL